MSKQKPLCSKYDFKEYIKILKADIKRLQKKCDLKDKEIKELKAEAKEMFLFP
jgi:peptidoglycan hydrolase CwlO-like protein